MADPRDPSKTQNPKQPQVQDPQHQPERMPGQQHEQQDPGHKQQPGSEPSRKPQNPQRG